MINKDKIQAFKLGFVWIYYATLHWIYLQEDSTYKVDLEAWYQPPWYTYERF